MESTTVKDLMVPLSDYRTVSRDATLLEAAGILGKALDEHDQESSRHRALLVVDDDGRIVGKLSEHDLMSALVLNYKTFMKQISEFIIRGAATGKPILRQVDFRSLSSRELREQAARKTVKESMYELSDGVSIDEIATIDVALRRLVVGLHHSILVTRDSDIVGVLRLMDVFRNLYRLLN